MPNEFHLEIDWISKEIRRAYEQTTPPPPQLTLSLLPCRTSARNINIPHFIIPILRQGSEKLRGKIKPNEESAKIDPKIEDNVRQIKTATGARLQLATKCYHLC